MRRLAPSLGAFLSAAVLGALGGCGDSQNRQEVTGEVTLKGRPLDDGLIHFEPLDGQGTGDGASVVNGKYRIPKEKGLVPGRYKVTLIAGDGRSGAGDASPDPPPAGGRIGRERIPPEYNARSKVVKEVTKDGPNQFDFVIP
jgi:hypothetical protein